MMSLKLKTQQQLIKSPKNSPPTTFTDRGAGARGAGAADGDIDVAKPGMAE